MRLFIAVPIPEGVVGKIAVLMERFRRLGLDAKWVSPENLHLTLKFLGEAPEELVPRIREGLEKGLAGFQRFDLYLAGMGVFPGVREPRVLWVGVTEGLEALKRYAASLESSLGVLGFPPERKPFKGHLTVARLRSRRNVEGLAKEVEIHRNVHVGPVPVDETILFRSVLGREGPTYTVQERFPLRRT